MVKIPSFLLKKLYVKNSLTDVPQGIEFALRNSLATGTVIGIAELHVDGQAYTTEDLQIVTAQGTLIPASSISPKTPLIQAAGVTQVLRLRGMHLDPGEHRITLAFDTKEMGLLTIRFKDRVRESVPVPSVTRQEQEGEQPMSEKPTTRGTRPIKVAILGAGSTVFARQLMTDILCVPCLTGGTFALVDIDAQRLVLAEQIARKLVEHSHAAWEVQASTDRRQVLGNCDYVISVIEVAGLRNVDTDYEIPLKYGVDQCIGDTIGPGGVFKMLRTGPDWLDILRDVEALCPGAVVMNYTNPMSALTLLALRATDLCVVGLCHSVPNTLEQLAGYVNVPAQEIDFRCAGINHMAWFVELTHKGQDLYPRLHEAAHNPEIYDSDPVRFEIMRHFGAFVTESSGHFSEYVPYFRKRPDLLSRYIREGYRGESGFYAHNWPRWRTEAEETVRDQLEGDSDILLQRSTEYASTIIEAIESGNPAVIHGNVRNQGLIDNLPEAGCVEVPVLVDATGLHPVRFGPLPTPLAALNAWHMPVHDLMVDAVWNLDRQAALHALLLDPLTAAVCSPDEITQMFDEMWAAQQADLAVFDR